MYSQQINSLFYQHCLSIFVPTQLSHFLCCQEVLPPSGDMKYKMMTLLK